jgi:hypothetical protein
MLFLDIKMVEVAGIEPGSRKPKLQKRKKSCD